MSHVSKRRVKNDVYYRIVSDFYGALFGPRQKQGGDFLRELLTPTERTMLAKRLAVIVMLKHDYSYYRIGKTLNVSVSTTRRFHAKMLRGAYPLIAKSGKRAGSGLSFLDKLEIFLSAGGILAQGPQHRKRIRKLKSRQQTRIEYGDISLYNLC